MDIDVEEFRQEARRLLEAVRQEFAPNILVGIRSGGYFLAEAMAAQADDNPVVLVPITRRRASTESKERLKLKRLVAHLPRVLKNALRVIEHRFLMTLAKPKLVDRMVPDPAEDRQLRAALEALGDDRRILIVDDAVDSGATMLAVMRYIRDVAGVRATIRTAVITVTESEPLIEPDFTLYRLVLCRFYWASDFA